MGIGLLYTTPIYLSCKYFPTRKVLMKRKAEINGLMLALQSLGNIPPVMYLISQWNPNNLQPTKDYDGQRVWQDESETFTSPNPSATRYIIAVSGESTRKGDSLPFPRIKEIK